MGVHTFPNRIYPKVNVIERLEFELTYYYPEVQYFNHYNTETPLMTVGKYAGIWDNLYESLILNMRFCLDTSELFPLKQVVSYYQ